MHRLRWWLTTTLLLCAQSYGQSFCLDALPPGFPSVDRAFQTGLPEAGTGVTAARSQLGEKLFHDARLSVSERHSCASCHAPAQAFTDGLPRSIGALDDPLPHNAPTLFNAALKHQLNWRDNGPRKLHEHHRLPLNNRHPTELGFEPAYTNRLDSDPELLALLALAQLLGPQQQPLTHFSENAITALLAHYLSDLRCATAFDALLLNDDTDAISSLAREGLALFTSTRLGCSNCHNGPLVGGGLRSLKHSFPAGLSERQRHGQTVTLQIPSLRLARYTAPYLFDGSAPSLEAVLTQYENGINAELPALALTPHERQALLAFLRTL